jgi:membrane protease YdiL (CAAX protease family)
VTAVVVTSLIFSAAHYRIDLIIASHRFTTDFGEPFSWFSFLFRFVAGVAFSTLFLLRGFGITAGTHAMYDLMTLLF